MKKIAFIAAAVFGLAVGAQAQALGVPLLKGMGYDGDLRHVTARLGLSENTFVDVGLGFKLDNTDEEPVANDDNNFQFGLSGFFLVKLQDWGPVDNFLFAGALFNKLAQADDNIALTLFGGFQPEVTLLDRLIVSTRFGLRADLTPTFILQTTGQPISIVEGLNFKVLF